MRVGKDARRLTGGCRPCAHRQDNKAHRERIGSAKATVRNLNRTRSQGSRIKPEERVFWITVFLVPVALGENEPLT